MRGISLPRETDPAAVASRVRKGDPAAEDELVGLLQGPVHLLVRRCVRDREAARELANDVLMAVVTAARRGRVRDGSKLAGFVRGTARNLVKNYFRTRFSRPVEEPLLPDLVVEDPTRRFESREQQASIRKGLEELRHMERQVLLMTIWDGFKPRRIARYLGLSSQNVRAIKSRAIRKLLASAGGGWTSVALGLLGTAG